MLFAKVEWGLSEECVEYLLNLWNTTPLVEPQFREFIPKNFQLMLASLVALGVTIPTLYMYDRCEACGHREVFQTQDQLLKF